MWTRASWPPVATRLSEMDDDIDNLATALAKIDFAWESRTTLGWGAARFVETDVEYIITVCRSMLDTFHKIVRHVWSNVQLTTVDGTKRPPKVDLPQSLSRFVLENDAPRSAQGFTTKYGIPEPLGTYFFSIGAYFQALRNVRDGIVHHGRRSCSIYVTEQGFAVDRDSRMFAGFQSARPESAVQGNVASLRPLLGLIVAGVWDICNVFTRAISSFVTFPPDITPGLKVYLRVPYAPSLTKALATQTGGPVWWDPEERAPRVLAPAIPPPQPDGGQPA